MIRISCAHFSSVRMCASFPFFVLFLPAGRNLAQPGYEIFSQFFHNRPDVFSLPISRGALQEGKGERIRSFLNDFTMLYGGAEFTKHIHMDAYVTRRILRPKQIWGSKATRIGGYKGEMYLVVLCEIWYSKTGPCKATRSDFTEELSVSRELRF